MYIGNNNYEQRSFRLIPRKQNLNRDSIYHRMARANKGKL